MSDTGPNLTGIPGGRSALEDRFDVVEEKITDLAKLMASLTGQLSASAANKITASKSSPTTLGTIKDGLIIALIVLIATLAFTQISKVEERAEKRLDDFSAETRTMFTDFRQRLKDDNDRAEKVHDRLISALDKLETKIESK